MKRHPLWTAGFVACLGFVGTGCGDSGAAADGDAGPPLLSVSAAAPVPTVPALDVPELRLKLQPGSRFPLTKIVRQSLMQGGPGNSDPVIGLSELELLMSVFVEEVAENGRARLRVRFERITYRQDAAGSRFEFDSQKPATNLPPEAAVYAAMTGDGFAVWLGSDNRIEEHVDFNDFLDRCLASVPERDRDRVMNRIAESSGDESLANFVDDSIGLLPLRPNHGRTAAQGDLWVRERRLVRPVRLFVSENCRLERLDTHVAEIDVTGAIAASETFDSVEDSYGKAAVRVTGGHSIGHCLVDRATGLPLESKLERLVKLRVYEATGREFDQEKRIETTIRAFPRQSATAEAA